MENENTEIKDSQPTGTDPFAVERLVAKVKAKPKKTIKSRHIVQSIETVKVATAFGATNKEIVVENEVVPEKPKTDEEKKLALEAELDTQLKQKLGDAIVPVDQVRLDAAKEIRQALSGLWSTESSPGYSPDDKYIEGIPTDGATAVENPDAGDSGVRISFKSKK